MAEINRREVISLSIKSFLGISAFLPILQSCSNLSANNVKDLDWRSFVNQIQDMAPEYGKEGFDEEAYLSKLISMSHKLNINDKDIQKHFVNYQNRNTKFPEFTKMHQEKSFQITLLEFEAGEKIPLHNHPDMSGVILCVKGNIAIDNFDLLPKKSENERLLLKQTDSVIMKPGMVGSLSSTRGNIHSLKATEFTRLIDIFTPPYDKRRIKDSRYFSKSAQSYKGAKGIFEAKYM